MTSELLTCFLICYFFAGVRPLENCPQPCHCYKTTANCSGHKKGLNYIPEVPSETKTLVFAGNWLPSVTKETFQNISHLQLSELILGGNHVTYISPDAFEIFPNLTFLDLSGNQMNMSILRESFYGVRNAKLIKLYLIEMNLTNLPEDMFEYLHNLPLEGLALAKNNLTLLNGKVFEGLSKLTHLTINNNKIKSVNLTGLEKIDDLKLRWNKLRTIPKFCDGQDNSFMPLLKVLDLGANTISQISTHQFRGICLPKLRNLTLDENQLRLIPNNVFSDLPNLKRLSLTWLKQNDIVFSRNAFNSSSLIHLYIGNHIGKFYESHDFKNLFVNCPNLKILDMTKIRLTSSNSENVHAMLSPLTKLEKLILQSTKLYSVPSNLFQKMPDLVNLNLESCLVSQWLPSIFVNVTSLKILYMDHNRITLINETSFPPTFLKQLTKLDLHDNQFTCNCEAFWFRQFVKNNKEKLPYYPRSYVCKSPSNWEDRPFEEYDPTYQSCHPVSPYIVLGVSIGVPFLLICIVVVIVYRYRWQLKHYIYLLRARKGYERIPDGEDYIYDAFVAYSKDDRVWIISKLVPYIEKEKKFKLCLHDRDFIAGKYIVDNIQENISRSRKVIIVLSNSFAASQWCNFEMKMAQMRHIQDGGCRVVVIMLEDIKAKHMNNTLHVLLQSTTYIQWTEDNVGRDLFWNKLCDAIKE